MEDLSNGNVKLSKESFRFRINFNANLRYRICFIMSWENDFQIFFRLRVIYHREVCCKFFKYCGKTKNVWSINKRRVQRNLGLPDNNPIPSEKLLRPDFSLTTAAKNLLYLRTHRWFMIDIPIYREIAICRLLSILII